jgi:hypothetical protein
MTAPGVLDAGWTIAEAKGQAVVNLLRDLDAVDAFPLRNALAKMSDASTPLVFDVNAVTYIAHSAQVVIREECKTRTVTLRGISDRLRRVLRTDSEQLLEAVVEEPAA